MEMEFGFLSKEHFVIIRSTDGGVVKEKTSNGESTCTAKTPQTKSEGSL